MGGSKGTWVQGWILSAVALGIAGCLDAPEETARVSEPISRGDTTNVSGSRASPEAAVGFVFGPNCSGTLIKRDVVLTAGHCVCNADPAIYSFQTSTFGPPGVAVKGLRSHRHRNFCPSSGNEQRRAKDLAVLFLERNILPSEVPEVVDVYTSGDFLDRVANNPISLFSRPTIVVGWGGSAADGDEGAAVHKGTAGFPLFWSSCGQIAAPGVDPLGGAFCDDATWFIQTDGPARTWPGDSGGPILVLLNGTTPTIFGVNSGGPDDEDRFSPTWNNGAGNGTWLRQFMDDDDDDDVNDVVDNCNPDDFRACRYDVTRCFNPDQTEADGDGVGDVCDNCPPSACTAQGRSAAACANPGQEDDDHDGVGDLCDLCPDLEVVELNDSDGDGVGDACDTCPGILSPFAACLGDGACAPGICMRHVSGGACRGGNFPITPGPPSEVWCETDADCAGGTCVRDTPRGRCDLQVDFDGDGRPNFCDLCQHESGSFQTNSNAVSEAREDASARGDICDAVPVFTSRSVLIGLRAPVEDGPDPRFVKKFLSSASIGNDDPDELHDAVGASAGFRHCSCLQSGSVLSREDCLRTLCDPNPADFTRGSSAWKAVTVGSSGPAALALGQPTYPPSQQGLDLRLFRGFSGEFNPNPGGVLPIPYQGETEQARIGELEDLFWFHQIDTDAGRVPTFSGGTAGLFWSHVYDPTGATSVRDDNHGGRLRNHYEYVTTSRDFLLPPSGRPTTFPPGAATACGRVSCRAWFRPDWLRDPRVVLPPDSLQRVIGLARFVVGPSGETLGVGNGLASIFDVTPVLSAGVRTLVASEDAAWLTPEEAGSRGGLVRPRSSTPAQLVAVAAPGEWRQTGSVVPVYGTPNGLVTGPELPQDEPDPRIAVTREASPLIPSDRDGAQYLFSATESRLILVGGKRGRLPTGEVWSYAIGLGRWTRLFTEPVEEASDQSDGIPQVFPGLALAAGYHSPTGKLIVLDEHEIVRNQREEPGVDEDDLGLDEDELDDVRRFSRGHDHGRRDSRHDDHGRHRHHARTVLRFLLYDVRAEHSAVALTVPQLGLADHFGLVARDDGRFVLVAANRKREKWTAWQFSIASDGRLRNWRRLRGRGIVLDRPVNTADGVFLPLDRNGHHELLKLEDSMFRVWPSGCRAL